MAERPGNQLLQALSAEDYRELSGDLRPIDLQRGAVLFEPDERVDQVWFAETGLIAVMTTLLSGDAVGTSLVASEGGVGLLEGCATGLTFSQAMVLAPGRFLRLPAEAYCDCLGRSASLRSITQAYGQLVLAESRQRVACHARHTAERRLAWLLLDVLDRLGEQQSLLLTQDDLAQVVAAQRTTVTQHAAKLREDGIIDYRRGRIEVLDRARLETAACECYAAVAKVRRRISSREGPLRARNAPVRGQG